ncbi:MAG: amidohydrolase family protein [Verrucomicrobiae bacterium]|nr:amidohydrolase family protein [Verrucomicrobiae bacterium]
MIWDLHTHLTRQLRGNTPAEKAAHLIEVGARHGIERFCCYMGMEWSRDPDPENLRKQNDDILEVAEAHPGQMFGFVYLNPKYLEASLDEMKRCLRDGPMVGVKLWVAERCSEPSLDPIVAYATELGVPVLQHTWNKTTGNLPGESTADDLARLAARHPDAKLICAHSGGNWELAIPAVRDFPNISIGLGGFDPTAGVTEMAVREIGAERVLFGSDAPGRSFASQIAKVTGADISASQRDLILGENLARILDPVLISKGLTE